MSTRDDRREMNRTVWIWAIAAMASASMAADDPTPRGEPLAQIEIFTEGYPRAFQFWTTTRRMIIEGEVDTGRVFQTLNGVASPCEYWATVHVPGRSEGAGWWARWQ